MKKLNAIILSFIVLTMSVCSIFTVSAEFEDDPLFIYKQRLSFLNKSYNLNYIIPYETATGGDYSEIIDFFSAMSLEEFDKYILSLKNEENCSNN